MSTDPIAVTPVIIDVAPTELNNTINDKLSQITTFVKDHFIDGGKLGASFAIAATRIAHGYAQATTEVLTSRLPEIQSHISALPGALRAAVNSGGGRTDIDEIRTQLGELSGDASLAARTGAMWGVAGLAYASLPLTLSAGYLLGASLGEQRLNTMIMNAMDGGLQ